MPGLGRIDRDFFEEFVAPSSGADRDDVTLGPRHGVDFGVFEVGEASVAVATDPIVLLPSLAFERAAWFAIHSLMSGVAVSGIPPSHLAVEFNLPPAMTDDEFETVWRTVDREATDHGVSIVTGHTARYAGCSYPMVGGGTAVAVGEPDRLVRPDGAQVGDRVVVTKGPAIAATGLLADLFESLVREGVAGEAEDEVGDDTIKEITDDSVDVITDDAMDRFDDASVVTDALTAAAAGPVHAMHAAAESGLYGGLDEMARVADVGIRVERNEVPVQPGVLATCEYFGVDPWIANSRGTLLAAVDPSGVDDVLAALADEGIPAADVGAVTGGEGLVVDGEPIAHPGHDPFWETFEEYREIQQGQRS